MKRRNFLKGLGASLVTPVIGETQEVEIKEKVQLVKPIVVCVKDKEKMLNNPIYPGMVVPTELQSESIIFFEEQ